MKTATMPALRVQPELRQAAEEMLQPGETLSGFVEESLRRNVERRQAQQAFLARGLVARRSQEEWQICASGCSARQTCRENRKRWCGESDKGIPNQINRSAHPH